MIILLLWTWGSRTMSRMLKTVEAGTLARSRILCHSLAFLLRNIRSRTGIRKCLFLTLDGLVENLLSASNLFKPVAWQKFAHWLSFPTARTRSLSLHLNTWYGTMLGCAEPSRSGSLPVAK